MTYHQNLLIQDRLLLCCNNRRVLLLLLMEDHPQVPMASYAPAPPYNQTPRPTAQLKPVPYDYLSFPPSAPDHNW